MRRKLFWSFLERIELRDPLKGPQKGNLRLVEAK